MGMGACRIASFHLNLLIKVIGMRVVCLIELMNDMNV